jgi:hypothetical protein
MTAETETCGHCGRPITTAARGWAADGTMLCHTGIIPPIAQPMDCYILVTRDGHSATGECCRTPALDWHGTAVPVLALLPWAASLTIEQRRQMLDEAAGAQDPASVVKRWKLTAKAAWPLQIHMVAPQQETHSYGIHPGAAFEAGRRQGRYEAGG